MTGQVLTKLAAMVYLLSMMTTQVTSQTKDRSTYGITNQCTCSFEKLPKKNCRAVPENQCQYPNHEDLGITEDCLPEIPDNSQVCFRTRVKTCQEGGLFSYHCRYFYNTFDLETHPMSQDRVELSSPPESDSRTVCFYRVNMSATPNCTSLRLHHKVDHPMEEYLDSLNVSNPCARSSDSQYRDYLKIYYGDENEYSREWCRDELAELSSFPLFNTTSFVGVYWTDATKTEGVTSSFKIHAECIIPADI